jgi:hypothetical protein
MKKRGITVIVEKNTAGVREHEEANRSSGLSPLAMASFGFFSTLIYRPSTS